MAEHLESVKALAAIYRTWADSSQQKGEYTASKRQLGYAESLEAVASEVEELRRVTKPIPASYGDISDLPPELLKELTGIKVDELEQKLFSIVKAGGNEVELDSILIELWRRHQVMQTRRFLQNKLWRMVQKGVIHSVSGKKGIYSAVAEGGFSAPSRGGFADDLDDDVPF